MAQEVQGESRSAGLRWHQGTITRAYKDEDGSMRYDGKHTKGKEDGKWCTFKDYSETFEGQKLEDLRITPNVYSVLVNRS